MTSESSKVMACSSAMAPVTLIGSPQKASKSHSCSSSFTSASVAHWPTVASTIDPTRYNAQTANSKPRMDWTIKDYKHANHSPVLEVNGNATTASVYLDVKVGQPVTLDASKSQDPDGN